MKAKIPYKFLFTILLLVLVTALLLNISFGSVNIPIQYIFESIFYSTVENDSWHYILWNYRLPKALTAIVAGGGLALSGLLMQTLFRNPLAGPFVLGISSGASLGVAILIMGSSLFSGFFTYGIVNSFSLALAASFGSFLVLLVVLSVAFKIKDTMALLIIGLMFGSITAAFVSVLSYFTSSEELQRYIFWTFGSLGDVSWSQLSVLVVIVFIGIILCIASIKSLNAFLLGENYAQSMGVHIKKSRYLIIIATALIAGSITAFAGPIAFVGLAIPHITRQFFNTTNHYVLVPAVFLCGALLMLICDLIAQLPNSANVLPINVITSFIGAPIVIWLLIRKQKMIF